MGAFNKVIAREETTLMMRRTEIVVRGELHNNGLWSITAEAWDKDSRDWQHLYRRMVYDEGGWDETLDNMIDDLRVALDQSGLV